MSWPAVRFCPVLSALFFVAPAVSAPVSVGSGVTVSQEMERQLDRLVAAYPDFLHSHKGNMLIWKDGTQMPFDDGRGVKSFENRLKTPDLEDQFFTPYQTGHGGLQPGRNNDPGRVRFQPFFTKMYGDCRKGQVAGKLETIVWLPRHGGRRIRVTAINGVASKLQQVSLELDRLIDKRPALRKFLIPASGTYNCRRIAGTNRYSVHAYGAAIDINVKQAHYWRWTKPDKNGLYRWRNRIPLEIVEIFEHHGFIWGGKWYHYDTMHFEYRPELLPPAPAGQ